MQPARITNEDACTTLQCEDAVDENFFPTAMLNGARLTQETAVALRLNEHPGFVASRLINYAVEEIVT